MKTFVRYSNLLPQAFDLVRDDSGDIRVYRDSEDNVYTSVTAFLSKHSSEESKAAIEKWKQSIGESAAAEVLRLACIRGTDIHTACERLLLNEKWYSISFLYYTDFIVMQKHLEQHVDNIFVLEHQMFSKKLGLAGTVDCIAEYNGKMSLIDFKTSGRIKYKSDIDSYFLQTAAYAIMCFERYGLILKQLVILMIVEGAAEVSVFIEPSVPWIQKIIKLAESEKL